jgi:hypothetical protein
MSKKENQHYVPKFYLRNFSWENNLKEIGIYNVVNNFHFERAPIKSQACRPYFYDSDSTIENSLSKLENVNTFFFKDIIAHNSLPPKSISFKEPLLKFILLFELRNPVAAENFEQSINAYIQKLPNLTNIPSGSYLKIPKAVIFQLSLLEKAVDCCSDLNVKLLCNITNVPFITSDNPVIKYNQFLERHKFFGGITGYGTKGLQFFLPISPIHIIVFYDSSVYKLGNKKETTIAIKSDFDVHQLNLLQCLNVNQTIFYNHNININYIVNLCNESLKYQKPNKVKFESNPSHIGIQEPKLDSEYLIHWITECRIKLKLDFVKELSVAKLAKIDNTQYQMRPKFLEKIKYLH